MMTAVSAAVVGNLLCVEFAVRIGEILKHPNRAASIDDEAVEIAVDHTDPDALACVAGVVPDICSVPTSGTVCR